MRSDRRLQYRDAGIHPQNGIPLAYNSMKAGIILSLTQASPNAAMGSPMNKPSAKQQPATTGGMRKCQRAAGGSLNKSVRGMTSVKLSLNAGTLDPDSSIYRPNGQMGEN